MFKKSKKEKPLHKKVAGIVKIQEASINQIEETLSGIEALQDPAEKILQLHELLDETTQAVCSATREKNRFINRRTDGAFVAGQISGIAAGGAAVAVPAAILFPPLLPVAILTGMIGMVPGAMATAALSQKKSQKLLNREPYISYFENIVAAQKNRARTTLDETEKGCDLGTISLSPRFKEALEISAELRDRVAEATIYTAKQALEKPVPKEEPKSAARAPISGKYKHLKI